MLLQMLFQQRMIQTRLIFHENYFQEYRKIVQTVLRYTRK